MATRLVRCSVVELVAIKEQARGIYQDELLDGTAPWGGRNQAKLASQRSLLERLQQVNGLLVVSGGPVVTIWGSLTVDGFARKL